MALYGALLSAYKNLLKYKTILLNGLLGVVSTHFSLHFTLLCGCFNLLKLFEILLMPQKALIWD